MNIGDRVQLKDIARLTEHEYTGTVVQCDEYDEGWSITVKFDDGQSWAYWEHELERSETPDVFPAHWRAGAPEVEGVGL